MSVEDASSEDPLDGLPHGEPFRFLDSIDLVESEKGEGVWIVRGDEDFLRGHFPGRPLVPGVLITEAAAQLAGVVARARFVGTDIRGMLVLSEARFKRPVEPPAEIQLSISGSRVIGSIHLFDFTATQQGLVCAEGIVGLQMEVLS